MLAYSQMLENVCRTFGCRAYLSILETAFTCMGNFSDMAGNKGRICDSIIFMLSTLLLCLSG